jgi:SprT protein
MNDISPELKSKLEDKVLETYLKSKSIFNREFELPSISFDLKGRVAGNANSRNHLRFNPILFRENVDDFLARTVPHEVAHLICFKLYPYSKQHHGPEWRSIMQRLGIQDIARCHSYDTTSVAQRKPRIKFEYKCLCKRHEVGNAIHQRNLSGMKKYVCTDCKTPIVYTGARLIPFGNLIERKQDKI